jgi:hypothetical protein
MYGRVARTGVISCREGGEVVTSLMAQYPKILPNALHLCSTILCENMKGNSNTNHIRCGSLQCYGILPDQFAVLVIPCGPETERTVETRKQTKKKSLPYFQSMKYVSTRSPDSMLPSCPSTGSACTRNRVSQQAHQGEKATHLGTMRKVKHVWRHFCWIH